MSKDINKKIEPTNPPILPSDRSYSFHRRNALEKTGLNDSEITDTINREIKEWQTVKGCDTTDDDSSNEAWNKNPNVSDEEIYVKANELYENKESFVMGFSKLSKEDAIDSMYEIAKWMREKLSISEIMEKEAVDWEALRERFFKECALPVRDEGFAMKLEYDSPEETFEWFKKEITKHKELYTIFKNNKGK